MSSSDFDLDSHPDVAVAAGAAAATTAPNIQRGVAVIQAVVKTLPNAPGVYRMLDGTDQVLYVGKAGSLKKRVASYTQPARVSHRIFRMVSETRRMEIVTTQSEVEALLLESNLIKRLRPRFNILLRDDKSFPFILIRGDHAFPQLVKHRGGRNRPGDYFGPFASAGAVDRTLTALQKAFLIRNCSDAIFNARSRPCLQYQIKRCAAPCVDKIDRAAYAQLVDAARAFLGGRSRQVQDQMVAAMEAASANLDFESAARYRDRIRALTSIQARQDINVDGLDDADLVALHSEGGASCIQVFFFRAGGNYGNRAYFPSHDKSATAGDVLAAFIGQFYDDKQPPRQVLVSHALDETALLAEALSLKAGRRVEVRHPQRGDKRKLIDHAATNARDALARRLAESASQRRHLSALAELFELDKSPERIEVYDNSHIQGSNAIGAMIVAGPEGFRKPAYRRFNIRNVAARPESQSDNAEAAEAAETIEAGDDFAMMRQVLSRRFARALKEDPTRQGGEWPDLVLIDGGAGQLSAARAVLAELGVDLPLVAIAKGPERNAGRERFFMPDRAPFSIEPGAPALYFLQRLRDEAHRFAIEGHRARRAKAMAGSPVDEIEGIGAKRKKALLLHFGSAR
ncbi:MAG: excinuclease ABC subunit UvrC, partial [Thalassobaculaceae bacterium]